MNVKNIIISGVVGGIVNYLLGWITYGMLFASFYPDGGSMNMMYVALGCLAFGFIMAYIYSEVGNINNLKDGISKALPLGLLIGLWMGFFAQAMSAETDLTALGVEVLITIIGTVGVGAAIGAVLGALNKE